MVSKNCSPLIIENEPFLKKLAKTRSERKCRHILKLSNTQQLLTIAEICLNIVKGRHNLTTRQKKRLFPYAHLVCRLSRARSEKGARKILMQQGNGIGGVLTALITPILIELGKKILKNDND